MRGAKKEREKEEEEKLHEVRLAHAKERLATMEKVITENLYQ